MSNPIRVSYNVPMSTQVRFPADETRQLSEIGIGGAPLLREVAQSGRPAQFIEDGQRVAVVLSPQLYDELCAAVAHLDLLTALDESIADIEAGRTVPHATVKTLMSTWLLNHQ